MSFLCFICLILILFYRSQLISTNNCILTYLYVYKNIYETGLPVVLWRMTFRVSTKACVFGYKCLMFDVFEHTCPNIVFPPKTPNAKRRAFAFLNMLTTCLPPWWPRKIALRRFFPFTKKRKSQKQKRKTYIFIYG